MYALRYRLCCTCVSYALPAYLMQELERVQKSAMRIICPGMEYQHALALANLPSVAEHHSDICKRTFEVFSMTEAINSGDYCRPYTRASTILGTRDPSAYRVVKQTDF